MKLASVRPRAPHLGPARRRPQILRAALEIAVDRGIGAVTMVDVAKHLAVTRPVVYACFPDRVELVDALLEQETTKLVESVLGSLRSTAGLDPEDAFVVGFQALLASALRHSESWQLILAGEPDPAVSERFGQARREIMIQASNWIAPAMRAWWDTDDLEAKLPVLIEFFLSSCESAIRSLFDESNSWEADVLGEFIGKAVYRAFSEA